MIADAGKDDHQQKAIGTSISSVPHHHHHHHRRQATTCHRSSTAADANRRSISIRNISTRASSRQRDAQTAAAASTLISEESSIKPLVSSTTTTTTSNTSITSITMTSGGFAHTAPLFAQRWRRGAMYKALCFLLLVLQGGALDFYLIAFTDPYWCSWIATDLVVISGWGVFFVRNARGKRERACGFHRKTTTSAALLGCGGGGCGGSSGGSGSGGSNLGEFTYAYLAWLIYVIACAPKAALVLETSPILELVALRVPCGVTGFKAALLLSAPLLYCLIHAVVEDPNGATRHHAHGCFLGTCLDLLDGFALVETTTPLLMPRGGEAAADAAEAPSAYLRHAAVAAYLAALGAPVLWLYELTAAEMRCRGAWARFLGGAAVNAPLLAVRCLQVYAHSAPVSVFMFKNAFFLACRCLELAEQCAAVRGARRFAADAADAASDAGGGGGDAAARFSRGVSENDMCPRGYVNTLAIATQS